MFYKIKLLHFFFLKEMLKHVPYIFLVIVKIKTVIQNVLVKLFVLSKENHFDARPPLHGSFITISAISRYDAYTLFGNGVSSLPTNQQTGHSYATSIIYSCNGNI